MKELIKGNEIAAKYKDALKLKIDALKLQHKRMPKLVVILVGEDAASLVYTKGKAKACEEVGILNETLQFKKTMSELELLKCINTLNENEDVDGILVQLPLPKHINAMKIIQSINPNKDVDGFHPINVGKLYLQQETFVPCTPKGIMALLDAIQIHDLSGYHALIIGRSNIVGKPIAQLLLQKNATVSVAHSKTIHLKELCRQADIVVACVGIAKFVKKDFLKPHAIVIDVGINRLDDHSLCGDVDFEAACEVVDYITPVPKGVGPMTIAMLLENTLQAYRLSNR